jgi:hypothetical protein
MCAKWRQRDKKETAILPQMGRRSIKKQGFKKDPISGSFSVLFY